MKSFLYGSVITQGECGIVGVLGKFDWSVRAGGYDAVYTGVGAYSESEDFGRKNI